MERRNRRVPVWVEKMIFLDSSFLVSVEVETDKNHERAVAIMSEVIQGKFGELVVSDYVFDETITVTFGRTNDLEKAVLVGENLMNSVKMAKIEESNFKDAWEIFKNQKVTAFSFTDCTIVALMKKEGIRNIATFDKDFKKVKDVNVVS